VDLSTPDQIYAFLARLGERLPVPADLYIFGGSALLLSGGRRNTADLDFELQSTAPEVCRETIAVVAADLDLDAEEAIPAEFMPLPSGAETRHRLIGQYGLLRVFLLDPYSIAIMKIDRAFPSDMEDVHFLLQTGQIALSRLEQSVEDVARRYDEPLKLRRHFDELKRGL
jgi:hypothetical protein